MADLKDPFDAPQANVPVAGGADGVVDPFDTPKAAPEQVALPAQDGGADIGEYAAQALRGATFDWGDEILGTLYGLYRAGRDGMPVGDAIKAGIETIREVQRRGEKKMGPVAATGMQIAGSIPLAFVGGGSALAQGTNLAKLGQAAKIGAIGGGVAGAGAGEGGFDASGVLSRGSSAAMGAGIGAVAAPVLTGGAMGLKSAGQYVGRLFPGGAERQARGVLKSVVSPEDAARMADDIEGMPSVSVLADVAPRDAQRITGAAVRRVGGGKAAERLEARHAGKETGQHTRLLPAISRAFSDETVIDAVQGAAKQRQLTASRNYRKAYEQALEETGEIKSILDNPALKDAWADAKKLAEYSGIVVPDNWDQARLKPTVELMDVMKQALDDQVDAAYRGGQSKLGGVLDGLRRRIRDEVDRQVPEYKDARSVYAGYSAAMEAAEKGVAFMRAAMGETAELRHGITAKAIKEMGEHETEAFRAGVASVLRDKVGAKGYGADVTKVFDNPLIREKVEKAIGIDAARSFLKIVDDEAAMARTFSELQGSQTQPREAAEKALQGVASLAQDAMAVQYGSPTAGVNILQKVADAVNAPPSAVARKVSDMMLTDDPVQKVMVLDILKRRPPPFAPVGARARQALNIGAAQQSGATQSPYLLKVK